MTKLVTTTLLLFFCAVAQPNATTSNKPKTNKPIELAKTKFLYLNNQKGFANFVNNAAQKAGHKFKTPPPIITGNFATEDLVFNDDRYHNISGYQLQIDGIRQGGYILSYERDVPLFKIWGDPRGGDNLPMSAISIHTLAGSNNTLQRFSISAKDEIVEAKFQNSYVNLQSNSNAGQPNVWGLHFTDISNNIQASEKRWAWQIQQNSKFALALFDDSYASQNPNPPVNAIEFIRQGNNVVKTNIFSEEINLKGQIMLNSYTGGIANHQFLTTNDVGVLSLQALPNNNLWQLGSANKIYYNSGNVGIGTANPQYKLDVHDGIIAVDKGVNNYFKAGPYVSIGNTKAGNAPYISFNAMLTKSDVSSGINEFTPEYATTDPNYKSGGLIIRGDEGQAGIHFLQKNFTTNSAIDMNDFKDVFTIDKNGNLGIGVQAPQAQLHNIGKSLFDELVCIGCTNGNAIVNPSPYKLIVEGTISAKKLKISTTPWADFVFDKTYNLMPLHSLEKYILQNKHLPQIPTTKTVEEQGIDVGEIQAKLLQKIEELTLYLIEQNKKIEALENKVNSLSK
jgi:hypothetical protein